jgi:hypothetical protein
MTTEGKERDPITQDRTSVGKIAKLSCNLLLGEYQAQ